MTINIRQVKSRKELRTFIHLPEFIHWDHKNWLPPIYVDEWKFFNPKKNRSFSHCSTILLLAYKEKEAVGRIMGIVNQAYNEGKGEKTARFGFLECYNDPDISHTLIRAIEDWASEQGMNKVIGPYGFSDKDPQGLQIEGFEEDPTLAAPCNEEYLVKLVEKEGYEKEVDCMMYTSMIINGIPAIYTTVSQRILQNIEYQLVEPKSKKELKPYIIPVLQMLNESYSNIYGFLPLDDQEMKEFAARYMPVLDPRFVKLICVAGEVIAFMIGLPSLTRGIQACRGYLFPFGILKLIKESKKTRQLDLMLGGVKPLYHNKGLPVPLVLKMFESAVKAGFKRIDIHLVLETNLKMRAELDRGGATIHKRFRVYKKFL
ncbi:MAG: hypothetical protein WCO63_09130 [Bacteroidota bacterium]